jgi:hypothetical protein
MLTWFLQNDNVIVLSYFQNSISEYFYALQQKPLINNINDNNNNNNNNNNVNINISEYLGKNNSSLSWSLSSSSSTEILIKLLSIKIFQKIIYR